MELHEEFGEVHRAHDAHTTHAWPHAVLILVHVVLFSPRWVVQDRVCLDYEFELLLVAALE